MSDVMKQQPNKGHFRLTYESQDGYSVLAQLDGVRKGSIFKVNIEATIESFGELNGYRADIVKRLGCAFSTVSEAMKDLQADGKIIIERNADGSTTWRSVRAMEKQESRLKAIRDGKTQEDPPELYYRVENFFLTHVFEFTYLEKKDENGDVVKPAHTVWRKLTPVEVLVLSVFYTHALNKSRSWFWTSSKKLADMLNLNPRTVERALRNLRAAQLVFRPVRGNSKSRHSKYVANMVMIRALCNEYEPKKAKKSAQETPSETASKKSSKKEKMAVQEAVAARQRFYSRRQQEAERLAERNRKYVAEKAPRFNVVKKELLELEKELALAEMHNPIALPALQVRQRSLQAERAQILRLLGVKDEWLVPQYRCKLCSDSGYMPSGKPCNCYHEYLLEQQAKKDVGELDKN